MLDRYYHAEAKKLGRKLLEDDVKSAAKPEARAEGKDQMPTEAALEGLNDEQRLKAQLALQLLREAGLTGLPGEGAKSWRKRHTIGAKSS